MITHFIWTTWTWLSVVSRKAFKLNHSLITVQRPIPMRIVHPRSILRQKPCKISFWSWKIYCWLILPKFYTEHGHLTFILFQISEGWANQKRSHGKQVWVWDFSWRWISDRLYKFLHDVYSRKKLSALCWIKYVNLQTVHRKYAFHEILIWNESRPFCFKEN